MTDAVGRPRLTANLHLFDAHGLRIAAPGLNNELVFAPLLGIEMQRNFVENGRGEGVSRFTWAVRIEAHHAEKRPSRHRSRVIIAGKSLGTVLEIGLQQLMGEHLCAPFLTFKIGEKEWISDVRLVGWVVVSAVKHRLKLLDEALFAAHELGQPIDIVGHIERVVPRIALMKARRRFPVGALQRVEWAIKLSIGQDRAQHIELLTEVMSVAHRAVIEQLCIGFVAQCGRQARQSIVGNVIFQRV